MLPAVLAKMGETEGGHRWSFSTYKVDVVHYFGLGLDGFGFTITVYLSFRGPLIRSGKTWKFMLKKK
jgi:hypothetical protein